MKDFEAIMNKIGEILPEALVEESSSGELVIYTGLQENENGKLIPLEDG